MNSVMYYSDEESVASSVNTVRTPCSVEAVICWADDYSSSNEEVEYENASCSKGKKEEDNNEVQGASCGSNEIPEIPEAPSCCGEDLGEEVVCVTECCEAPCCFGVVVGPEGVPPEGCIPTGICEGPHCFKQFTARDGNYKCGGCNTPVPKDAQMLGCTQCTFDICMRCMETISPAVLRDLAPSAPTPSAPSEAPPAVHEPPHVNSNPLMMLPLPSAAPSYPIGYAIHPAPNTPPPPPTSYGHKRRPRRQRYGTAPPLPY